MNVIPMQINSVKPYENNPRNNDDAVEATANSIKEFGWQQPIVVDKNNVVVAGHTRLKAAEQLGLTEVPVVVADNLTDDQVKAYRLADNKTSELADWDFPKLEVELGGIENIDMSQFEFKNFEFEDNSEAVDDDFEEELTEASKSKSGDIYKLGRHRLMCGDSTDSNQVEQLMAGEKADMLITDPPYNVSYAGKTKDQLTIQNDSMDNDEFYNFLFDSFTSAKINLKKGASFYIWYSSSEAVNFISAAEDAGLSVRQQLIWKKNQLVVGRQDYQWIHEPCIYGWENSGTHKWNSDRKQTTVLEFDKPSSSQLHPTMKPIPLFDYQIKNSSKEGDRVLDLFGGSGTTLMACEQNNRNSYLMEMDPKYVDVIIDRWETFTGNKAELISDK